MSSSNRTPADGESRDAEADRIVPLREKIALGFGDLAAQGSHGAIHVLAQPVFSVTMGMSPALVSTMTFIQRIWDAFIDPICGRFSDRLTTRWGRRRPLIFVGAFPLAFFFILLWRFPQKAGPNVLFAYVLVVSLLFYAGQSLVAVPLNCLKIEASTNYHERTRVAAFSQAFRLIFEISTNWIFPLTQLALFASPIAGLHGVTTVLGLGFFAAALAPALALRERLGSGSAARPEAAGWRSDLRALLANGPFLQLLAIRGIGNLCYYLVQIFGMYMNFYYIHHGDIRTAAVMQGWLGTIFQLASVAATLSLRSISVKIGKRGSLQIAAAALMAGGAAKLFIYDTGLPWLQAVVYVCNASGLAGISLLTSSMLAEVVDYAELSGGLRREGLHVAFLNWSDKLGNSLGTLFSGFLLVWLGFAAKLGPQTAATLHGMKLTYAVIPAVGAAAVMVIAHYYRIDENYAREMRKRLASAA